MVESDDGSDKGFASRWSRRKRETRVEEPAEPLAPAGSNEVPARAGETSAGAPDSEPAESNAPEVPDPDTLDAEADFTVFLQDGVPEALRRRALRRLWRLNPVFANLDGLNDYDDDYTDAAAVVEGLQTLYKAGKGLVVDEDENKADENKADEKPGQAAQAGGGVAAETPEEAPTELERGPDSPGGETGERDQVPASHGAPAPAADEAGKVAVSGPGKRRRGALARRWGAVDD